MDLLAPSVSIPAGVHQIVCSVRLQESQRWKKTVQKVNHRGVKYQRTARERCTGRTYKINSHLPYEQRRFWNSSPQGVARGTRESPLSGPCLQDPRSTGVVLQWEAAVSVEQTDPAMECHASRDMSSPAEWAARLSWAQHWVPLYFLHIISQRNTMGGDLIYAEPNLTGKPVSIWLQTSNTQSLNSLAGRQHLHLK